MFKVKFICKDKEDMHDNYDDMTQAETGDTYSGDYGMEMTTSYTSTMSSSYSYSYANDYTTGSDYSGILDMVTHADMGCDKYDSSHDSSDNLSTWEKAELINEQKTLTYMMTMEQYSCRILWMEHFQHKLYNSFDRQAACCESIDTVMLPCYMRWSNEPWAVQKSMEWEKFKFCGKTSDAHQAEFDSFQGMQGRSKDYYKENMEQYGSGYEQQIQNKFFTYLVAGGYEKCWTKVGDIYS